MGLLVPHVPHVFTDAAGFAQVLRASGLNWRVVRGSRLTDKPFTSQYRVGWVGVNASASIGRPDLADFILKQVESEEFAQQMPSVSA